MCLCVQHFFLFPVGRVHYLVCLRRARLPCVPVRLAFVELHHRLCGGCVIMRRRKTREKKPRSVCCSVDLRYATSHEWAATGSSIIPTAKIAQSQINSQGIAFVKRGKRAGRPRGSWRVTAFGLVRGLLDLITPIDYRVAHRQNSRISILHNPTTGTNFAAPFCCEHICEVEAETLNST